MNKDNLIQNKKEFFPNWKKHDMHSYKLTNLSAAMNNLIEKLSDEYMYRLENGFGNNNIKARISMNSEGPTCFPNYADQNIDRKVPTRQYFGQKH